MIKMVDKKDFFCAVFSGVGNGLGFDLSSLYSSFIDVKLKVKQEKAKDSIPKSSAAPLFLDTALPDEYQAIAKDIVSGLLNKKGRDYSFIPSSVNISDFTSRWNCAYDSSIAYFRKFTGDIFDFFSKSYDFKFRRVYNQLEYKTLIKVVHELHSCEYRDLKKYFEDSFSAFERNVSNQNDLEKIITNIDFFYRVPKGPSSSGKSGSYNLIDAFSMRVKSPSRIAQKFARKLVNLVDKFEECRKKNLPFVVSYDDIFLTDIFGFLVLNNRHQNLDESVIYRNRSLATIEDSHKNSGQRQVKLIDAKSGVFYDWHLFRTLKDLVDNEFSREGIEKRPDILPHKVYMDEKLRVTLNKNPELYEQIYGGLIANCEPLLRKCRNSFPGKNIPEIFSGVGENQMYSFLEHKERTLLSDLAIFRNNAVQARNKDVLTFSGLQRRVDELINCYSQLVRQRLNFDLEQVCSFGTGLDWADGCLSIAKESVARLVKDFERYTKSKYSSSEAGEFRKCYSDIADVCCLNRIIKDRHDNAGNLLSSGFNDEAVLANAKFYKNALKSFSEKYSDSCRLYAQTKFNIYKYLINSYKMFVTRSSDPNRRQSDGIPVSILWGYMNNFRVFVSENNEKLSMSQNSEVEDILDRSKV